MPNEASITIPVELDDKQAQKELTSLNRKIMSIQRNMEVSSVKRDGISSQLREAAAEADKTRASIADLTRQITQQATAMGVAKAKGYAGMEEYDAAKASVDELLAARSAEEAKLKEQEAAVERIAKEENKVNGKLKDQQTQLELLKTQAGEYQKRLSMDSAKSKEGLGDKVAGLKKGFSSILKYAFGLRSIYALVNLIRNGLVAGVKDFAKADKETKGNLDSLKASLAVLRGSWGAAFAPILNAVAPILQTLIGWLTKAGEAIANFMAVLTGRGTYKRAVNNQKALANAIGGTGGAAKDAQRQLAGFDEITKLQAESGGGGGGAAVDYEDVETRQIPILQKLVSVTKEWASSMDFTNLIDAWHRLKEAVSGFAESAGKILLWLYENVLLPIGTWLIETAIPFILNALATALEWISDKLEGLASVLNGDQTFMEWLDSLDGKDIIILAIAAAIVAVTVAVGVWNAIAAIGSVVTGALGAAFEFLTSPIGLAIIIIAALTAAVALLVKHFEEVIAFIKKATEKITEFFNNARESVRDAAQNTADFLTEKFGDFGALLGGIIETIAGVIETIISVVQTAVSLVWAVISSVVALIGGLFKGDLKSAIETIGTVWASVWEGIKNIARSVINIVFGLVESWINGIIDGINRMLGVVNNVAGIFGGNINWQLNYVSLPRLAKGGIVDSATAFIAGESGKEAVIPLERNTGWVTMVANEMADVLLGNNVIDRFASAIMNTPMPAMAMGYAPPRVVIDSSDTEWSRDILDRIDALTERVDAILNRDETTRPINIDGKRVSEIVTQYQRNATRSGGR